MYICQLFTKYDVLLNKLLSKHVDPARIAETQFLISFQNIHTMKSDPIFRDHKTRKIRDDSFLRNQFY